MLRRARPTLVNKLVGGRSHSHHLPFLPLVMSWFDSSYSFARTAFSHAQKSIDKVLDINEARKENEEEETGKKIITLCVCKHNEFNINVEG